MQLPLSEEESRVLRAVLAEYLASLEEEMVRTRQAERNAAMHRVEAVVRTIGERLA